MFEHKNNRGEETLSEREEYNTELLERIWEMTEENNKILKSLRTSERRANIFRIIYWTLVLSALFGLFYYLKPIVDFVFQNFAVLKDGLYGVAEMSSKLPETNNLQNIIDQIKQ